MSIAGKVAIVTGGAQGIGRAIVEVLAQHGADVVIASLNLDKSRDLANKIERGGRQATPYKVNVAEWSEVKGMIDHVLSCWGRIDILINNAGTMRDGLVVRMKEEDWDFVLKVNLYGTFHCTKAVLPTMVKQQYGRIVNVTSVLGVTGNSGQANYVASKAAVIGFTRSIAREYAHLEVTVNALAPGFIDTPLTRGLPDPAKDALQKQIPLGRVGKPLEVAEAARFLVCDGGYITGHVLHVNGGMFMG